MSDYNEAIGKKLRTLRKQQGKSMQEIGEHIGVVKSVVHNYETGKTPMNVEQLKKYLDVLGISLNDFTKGL